MVLLSNSSHSYAIVPWGTILFYLDIQKLYANFLVFRHICIVLACVPPWSQKFTYLNSLSLGYRHVIHQKIPPKILTHKRLWDFIMQRHHSFENYFWCRLWKQHLTFTSYICSRVYTQCPVLSKTLRSLCSAGIVTVSPWTLFSCGLNW